jgi:uncharacterized repeat protein (TIGR03803 family)
MKKQFLIPLAAFMFLLALPTFAASSPKGGIIYTFKGGSDGANPMAPLIADTQGNLYGTTIYGGGGTLCSDPIYNCGTVFELLAPLSPSGTWQEKILYAFTGGSDGSLPVGGLIFDSAGNLYGTTAYGGDLNNTLCNPPEGCGVVFELSPPARPGGTWTESVLHAFESGTDGAVPENSLLFDKAGNLYGTSLAGGMNSNCTNCGTIFELSPAVEGAWTESTLYSFTDGNDAAVPTSALVFDGFGNLYEPLLARCFNLFRRAAAHGV